MTNLKNIDGGVLQARDWDPSIDPTGYWASIKYDGIQAYWNGGGLYSRAGNRFEAPDWYTRHLPRDVALVGELYAGLGGFQRTLSVVKRGRPRPVEWASIRYMVFDAPNVEGDFEDRLFRAILELMRLRNPYAADDDKPPYVPRVIPFQPIIHTKIESREHYEEFHRQALEAGEEGTMLRARRSSYDRKRSHVLLRRKPWFTEEFKVIGYKPGRNRGLGALMCVGTSGPIHEVGSGLSEAQVRDPPPVGSVIEVKFKGRTERGHLREPSLVCVRDYE